jgi:thymidine phosphorylase
MTSIESAEELARSIIATAATAALKTRAIITDMNECLGRSAGNALEIAEAVEFLRNDKREARLNEVVLALCAEMLLVAGLEDERATALARVDEAVSSGRAVEIFDGMVRELGGPADFSENYAQHLPRAPVSAPVFAREEGFVSSVDTFKLGNAIIELGGGRRVLGEALDLAVGLDDIAGIGTEIGTDRPIATIHANTTEQLSEVSKLVRAAYSVSATAPADRPVICRMLDAS